MCGIAGELRFEDGPVDAAALGRMADAMAPRGPDGSGIWARDGRGLAHRRLRIIDLSERGSQPMSDPELGITIAFNGCIYNYRELREELSRAGYRFFSSSDTEVLIKAYHRWGPEFVHRLLGMFAFAIAEHDSGLTVLGRDRLGVKPLYLAERAGAVRFASTLPALLAAGTLDTSIDPVALHHYLSWHAVVPAPLTILQGVRKLGPATVMTIAPDGARSQTRYWQPDHSRPPRARTEAEWVTETADALALAVRRRMVADVPVGVLLSGGLDSSLIAGLLAREGQSGLETFAIGFPAVGAREGDEFEYSDLVARELGTEHHRIEIPTARVIDALPRAVEAMSEPMVSHDTVAFYLLAEEVSHSITVVQSGQGADEVFGGYHWYPRMSVATAGSRDGELNAYQAAFFDRSHTEVLEVLADGHRVAAPVSRDFVAAHFAADGADSGVDRALRLDQQVMLVEDPVKRVDNMTMAHGLEARVPFLDHELVELAAGCPPELKLGGGGKGILKQVARGLIPDAVIDRPKGYFPVPALVQLTGPVLELVNDAMTSSRARTRGLWNRDHVERLLAAPNAHMTPSGANQLWQLALLEMWLERQGI